MLATSKNVIFQGHNHLLTTGTDGPSLAGPRVIIIVSGHQYRWLAGGYDLEIKHFLELASMVVTWWIVAFLRSVLSFLPMMLEGEFSQKQPGSTGRMCDYSMILL